MATTSIGQLRYSNTSQCYSEIGHKDVNAKDSGDATLDYIINSTVSDDDEQQAGYADLTISLDSGASFDRNTDYYVKIDLPQNVNYDFSFNIRLCKQDESSSESYQYLKTFTMPKGNSSSNSHSVALYAVDPTNNNSSVKAMIPVEVDSFPTSGAVSGTLYHKRNTSSYAVGRANGKTQTTTKVNAAIMTESWKQDITGSMKSVEIVFRPVVDGMNYLKFQMVRTTQDSAIRTTVTMADGETTKEVEGRAIQLTDVSYKLYKLNNLLPDSLSSFSRIGVWSHSGLLMAVNGEEIRVGASGYYELAVLPVNSLGIVAQGYQDNWTLDYEYEK